jgi:hypothetical protein
MRTSAAGLLRLALSLITTAPLDFCFYLFAQVRRHHTLPGWRSVVSGVASSSSTFRSVAAALALAACSRLAAHGLDAAVLHQRRPYKIIIIYILN